MNLQSIIFFDVTLLKIFMKDFDLFAFMLLQSVKTYLANLIVDVEFAQVIVFKVNVNQVICYFV